MANHIPPTFHEILFSCPYCGALAPQHWAHSPGAQGPTIKVFKGTHHEERRPLIKSENLDLSQCSHCYEVALWYEEKMLIPSTSGIEGPNYDLPDEVKADYNEARAIAMQSPRGAAALLRLALQKLCKELGGKGERINDDIAYLVREKRLDPSIQQALDIIRVTGNNAVHPGELDIRDDHATVLMLFSLVNEIAEDQISKLKRIGGIYARLPENALAAIAKRDQNAGSSDSSTKSQ